MHWVGGSEEHFSWAAPLGQFGQDYEQRRSVYLGAVRHSATLYEGTVYTQPCPSQSLGQCQPLCVSHQRATSLAKMATAQAWGRECDGSRGNKQNPLRVAVCGSGLSVTSLRYYSWSWCQKKGGGRQRPLRTTLNEHSCSLAPEQMSQCLPPAMQTGSKWSQWRSAEDSQM